MPFSSLQWVPGSAERRARTVLTAAGEIVAAKISAIKEEFPTVNILRRVVMPEHIHLVLFVTEASEFHLGDVVSSLKQECTRAYHGMKDRCAELPAVFESGYHDRILAKRGQLNRMLAYVSDNPRRRLERMAHPEFHRRSLLTDGSGSFYEAYGNIQLLEDFDIEAVKVSSKYSVEELRQRKLVWLRTVQNGGVLVSPFISKDEKRVFEWARDHGGRIILLVNNGFGKNYTPKGKLHTLCTEGRLLIVAPPQHSTSAVATDRASCLRMNSLAEAIAEYGLRAYSANR